MALPIPITASTSTLIKGSGLAAALRVGTFSTLGILSLSLAAQFALCIGGMVLLHHMGKRT